MRAPLLALGTVAVIAVLSARVEAQEYHQPAVCPEVVDPGLLEYPTHVIPYSDGENSGNFHVDYLWDTNLLKYGYRSDVTYITSPEVPQDVSRPRVEWRFAAVDADCYWINIGFDRFRVVEERALHGIVHVPNDLACGGVDNPLPGDNSGFVADYTSTSYDPLDPNGDVGSGCGSGSGGGGGGDGGQLSCHTEYAYLDELINGVWIQIWEGYVTVCE
jgi:hypothetical protein